MPIRVVSQFNWAKFPMKIILNNYSAGQKHWNWFGTVSLILLLAGCSEKSATENATDGKDSAKVVIRGSNTFGEELAPQLIAEYKKDHPAASFDLETKGTPYGMGALMGGFCDIAAASRLPSKEELEVAQFRNIELNDHTIGAYSVAVVINSDNAVEALFRSVEDVCAR